MSDSIAPSLYTFGSMSLGSDLAKMSDHIAIARAAMEAGVWFHSSPTYNRGFTYMILRMAFDEARSQTPPMIIKIRCGDARLLRFEVEDALRRLGIERIDVAQLVFTETGSGPLVRDFTEGGIIADACTSLRREGKVAKFCPQISRADSPAFMQLAERKAFDGFVLYLSPVERDVDDAMWSLLQRQGTPLWALRTIANALGEPARFEQMRTKNPNEPRLPIAQRVTPLVAKSGVNDWTDFCLRYAAAVPHLQTTIGGTGDMGHLRHFLESSRRAKPLPANVMAAIDAARRG